MEKRGKKAFIPLAVMLVLLVINIPSGILFSLNENHEIIFRPLWGLGLIIQLGYLFYTLTLVRKYKKLYGGLHFFSIKSFIIPFLLGVILQIAMSDWVFVTIAAAVGLVFIYMELLEKRT